MGLYGPYTAVQGTVQQITGIDANAVAVFIENLSTLTLALAFTANQPPALATLNGDPWSAAVPPGGKLVPIPFGNYGGGTFPGYFYVLPMQPLNNLATTGTISANNQFFVQSLRAGEAAPSDYSTPQYMNAASQERAVSLEATAFYNFTGAWASSAAGHTDLFPAIWGPSFIPPGQTQSGYVIVVYLTWVYMAASPSGASAPGATQWKLQFVQLDGGGTAVNTLDLVNALTLQGTVTTGDTGLAYSMPKTRGYAIGLAATAQSGVLRILQVAGQSPTVYYDISADIDWWNQKKIPFIGGGASGQTSLVESITPGGVIQQLY